MEKLVIQPDKSSLPLVENFVRAICDGNHIVNYYATISVPVLKAFETAILSSSSALSLIFDHCRGGIYFSIQSDVPCFFFNQTTETVPAAGSPEESSYLIETLSDRMEVSDEGRTLQLTFEVEGIDIGEATLRVQALKLFYESISTQVHQTVEV